MAKPEYTVDWTTPYTATWAEWLKDWAGKPNLKALEVGCHEGRSSRWFCEHVLTGANCRLDCVDSWSVKKYAGAEDRFDRNTTGLPIRKIKEPSQTALPRLILDGNRYVFVYVDGSHIAEHCLFDLIVAWQMVCHTGVLIADDYGLTSRTLRYPPKLAIDGLLACLNESRAGHIIRGNQVAVWKS